MFLLEALAFIDGLVMPAAPMLLKKGYLFSLTMKTITIVQCLTYSLTKCMSYMFRPSD